MCAIEIRSADPSDAARIAQTHVRSWRAAYKGIVEQAHLDHGLDIGVCTQRWQNNLVESGWKKTLAAFENAKLAGFATVGPSRDDVYPDYAEIYCIYLDPDWLGKGVGALLFNRAAQLAREHGFEKMFVDVLSDNAKACASYERMGAILAVGREKNAIIDGKSYPESVYVWANLSAL